MGMDMEEGPAVGRHRHSYIACGWAGFWPSRAVSGSPPSGSGLGAGLHAIAYRYYAYYIQIKGSHAHRPTARRHLPSACMTARTSDAPTARVLFGQHFGISGAGPLVSPI